jgi:hypothetical protein
MWQSGPPTIGDKPPNLNGLSSNQSDELSQAGFANRSCSE